MADLDPYRAQLEAALWYAKGSHTFDDVRQAVESGAAQFWPGVASCIVTQIVQTPQRRELQFWLAGGNMDEMRRLYPVILEWGKAQGCQLATMTGRPGWAKSFLMRDEGWKQTAVVYAKDMSQ